MCTHVYKLGELQNVFLRQSCGKVLGILSTQSFLGQNCLVPLKMLMEPHEVIYKVRGNFINSYRRVINFPSQLTVTIVARLQCDITDM